MMLPISRKSGMAESDQLALNSNGVELRMPETGLNPICQKMPTLPTSPRTMPTGNSSATRMRTAAKPIMPSQ